MRGAERVKGLRAGNRTGDSVLKVTGAERLDLIMSGTFGTFEEVGIRLVWGDPPTRRAWWRKLEGGLGVSQSS